MKQNLSIFSAVLIFSFLVVSFVVFGQQNSQNNTRPFSELTFVVTPERDTFLPMEPIVLRLTLINNTNSPVLGHTDIDFNSGYVDLSVSDRQGNKRRIGSLPTVIASRMAKENKLI